jgi:hypothetical protein
MKDHFPWPWRLGGSIISREIGTIFVLIARQAKHENGIQFA